MSDIKYIEPDLDFVTSIKKSGGESLQKCYQCASCSVICNVSPDNAPFPRKEMIWAQWGLKERLLKNPDIWLCYQCNDCSIYCPRSAKPSDVLAAIRNLSFKEYAFPSFFGKALSDLKYLPLLFAIPVIILLFTVFLVNGFSFPIGEIVFSKFLPIKAIDFVFIPVAIFAGISVSAGILKFWKALNENNNSKNSASGGNILKSIFLTIIEILKHDSFKKCEANKKRFTSHLLIFFGFLGLFATTNLVLVLLYLFGIETPLPLNNPVKILGNVSALAAFIGCSLIIFKRLTDLENTGNSTYFDWTFINVLFGTVITGILAQLFRLGDLAVVAYSTYFIHLVFVFFLLAYAPFSKFAHIFYRTVAIVYSKYSNRENAST
tara:strand:+ start:8092 stop:9222 length:1131 start_codon:yes stop_codon:yes gene_type:complete